jgi:hypothetical protein
MHGLKNILGTARTKKDVNNFPSSNKEERRYILTAVSMSHYLWQILYKSM